MVLEFCDEREVVIDAVGLMIAKMELGCSFLFLFTLLYG